MGTVCRLRNENTTYNSVSLLFSLKHAKTLKTLFEFIVSQTVLQLVSISSKHLKILHNRIITFCFTYCYV